MERDGDKEVEGDVYEKMERQEIGQRERESHTDKENMCELKKYWQ